MNDEKFAKILLRSILGIALFIASVKTVEFGKDLYTFYSLPCKERAAVSAFNEASKQYSACYRTCMSEIKEGYFCNDICVERAQWLEQEILEKKSKSCDNN